MAATVIFALVGAVCTVLGFALRRGDIGWVQEHHIRRVSEEDRIPFGRRMGLGLIAVGGTITASGVLIGAAIYTTHRAFLWAGTVLLALGLGVGVTVCLRAVKKYNKGIF